MNIGILGTGMVGRAHAAKFVELGHTVMLGTRDGKKTMATNEKDAMGNPPFAEWHKDHTKVKLVTFAEAATSGDVVYNALKGEIALSTLSFLKKQLTGKILIDVSNPLDFSKGMPPTLFVCNTDSLGEQIQSALPKARVVKAFNTMNAYLQVDPRQLEGGDHHLFVSGNDADAKAQVIKIAKEWYGWEHIIDLGDITTSRGTEMILAVWIRLWSTLKTPMFAFKIVK
ncbi:MAG: NADP oxidoreductase [Candidatus Yonathbacteria bacterium CG_4_9_14_0_2_um_filter_47_74]|nr:MAG: NADP oxidoreductase [Candidatus Yonathbacteria bacterium CG_4_9_14_0_2_um_filter_47_74]